MDSAALQATGDLDHDRDAIEDSTLQDRYFWASRCQLVSMSRVGESSLNSIDNYLMVRSSSPKLTEQTSALGKSVEH